MHSEKIREIAKDLELSNPMVIDDKVHSRTTTKN
jgi:hypothetical protein